MYFLNCSLYFLYFPMPQETELLFAVSVYHICFTDWYFLLCFQLFGTSFIYLFCIVLYFCIFHCTRKLNACIFHCPRKAPLPGVWVLLKWMCLCCFVLFFICFFTVQVGCCVFLVCFLSMILNCFSLCLFFMFSRLCLVRARFPTSLKL